MFSNSQQQLKDLKSFVVVHFYNSDDTYEVVPRHWISEDQTTSHFPAGPSKAVLKLQTNKNTSVDPAWPVYDINIIKSYEEFERANKKASRIAKNPNDNSEVEGRTRSRRRVTVEPNPLPIPPEGSLFGEQQPEFEDLAENLNVTSDVAEHDASSSNNVQLQWIADPRIGELLTEFRAFQTASLYNQIKLQKEVAELKELLIKNHSLPGIILQDGYPKWPLKSEEEFQLANEHLQIETNFKSQVELLARIGGSTIPITVYNVLNHIISHDLAVNIRLTNKSGKVAFGNSLMAKLVREAVKNCYRVYDETTASEIRREVNDKKIDTIIGKWFRGSSEREGGRKLKKKDENLETDQNQTNPKGSTGDASEDSSEAGDPSA